MMILTNIFFLSEAVISVVILPDVGMPEPLASFLKVRTLIQKMF